MSAMLPKTCMEPNTTLRSLLGGHSLGELGATKATDKRVWQHSKQQTTQLQQQNVIAPAKEHLLWQGPTVMVSKVVVSDADRFYSVRQQVTGVAGDC